MLSVCAYAVKLWDDQVHVLPDALLIVRMIIGTGAIGLFWLFVAAVFDDKPKLHPWMLAAVAALLAVDFTANFPGAPANLWLGVLANLMRIAMALAALAIIVRGWKGDLVEPHARSPSSTRLAWRPAGIW
jgi:hypothetical protein